MGRAARSCIKVLSRSAEEGRVRVKLMKTKMLRWRQWALMLQRNSKGKGLREKKPFWKRHVVPSSQTGDKEEQGWKQRSLDCEKGVCGISERKSRTFNFTKEQRTRSAKENGKLSTEALKSLWDLKNGQSSEETLSEVWKPELAEELINEILYVTLSIRAQGPTDPEVWGLAWDKGLRNPG